MRNYLTVLIALALPGCAQEPLPDSANAVPPRVQEVRGPIASSPPTIQPAPRQTHTPIAPYPSTGIEYGDPLPPRANRVASPVENVPSPEREQAIAVAREFLRRDQPDSNGIDYNEYRVKRTKEGYTVFVTFLSDRGLYFPGGHYTILLSSDWKVDRVIGGL